MMDSEGVDLEIAIGLPQRDWLAQSGVRNAVLDQQARLVIVSESGPRRLKRRTMEKLDTGDLCKTMSSYRVSFSSTNTISLACYVLQLAYKS
jgi:hypothetical protein